ncbi:hypothetical protein QTP88_028621 [Uroleucon formosanum]
MVPRLGTIKKIRLKTTKHKEGQLHFLSVIFIDSSVLENVIFLFFDLYKNKVVLYCLNLLLIALLNDHHK